MADEAKAAVACMAAWLRFVIDDLFENCLTHDALISYLEPWPELTPAHYVECDLRH